MDKIKSFINRFHISSDIDEVFTSGCCYWFAFVLLTRFADEGAVIMYDEICNHYGTRINGRVYDITGDVTDDYFWIEWGDLDDEIHKERIIRDCIMF